jgi:hypothetical protein
VPQRERSGGRRNILGKQLADQLVALALERRVKLVFPTAAVGDHRAAADDGLPVMLRQ